MSAVAIIPARGGSKRIPRKNIRSFCCKPIIAYSIETALESNCFDEVMVSTDDEEIADISRQYGAAIPFFRSAETSNDFTGILEVLKEVIGQYLLNNIVFNDLCCILPTAPLVRPDNLISAYRIFKNGNFDSVFPVVRFSYPIQRALQLKENRISMMWPENYEKRSQDLPHSFHDTGQFYWIHQDNCFKKNKIFTDNSGAIIIPETQAQDIDTDEDWKICELKYQNRF